MRAGSGMTPPPFLPCQRIRTFWRAASALAGERELPPRRPKLSALFFMKVMVYQDPSYTTPNLTRKAVPPRWGCSLRSQSSAPVPTGLVHPSTLIIHNFSPHCRFPITYPLPLRGIYQLLSSLSLSPPHHPKSVQKTDKPRVLSLSKGIDDSYPSPSEP